MEEFLQSVPDWIKAAITFIFGAGGGGFGIHQWYKMWLKKQKQEFNHGTEYRDELRGDVNKLRKRQEEYEKELAESRGKYFEMQEKYHQLKLNHEETIRENRKMREEIKKLRQEIKKLRDKLNENG